MAMDLSRKMSPTLPSFKLIPKFCVASQREFGGRWGKWKIARNVDHLKKRSFREMVQTRGSFSGTLYRKQGSKSRFHPTKVNNGELSRNS
jgi:hypothetical protein